MHVDQAILVTEALLADLKRIREANPNANIVILDVAEGFSGDPEEFPRRYEAPSAEQLEELKEDDCLDEIIISRHRE